MKQKQALFLAVVIGIAVFAWFNSKNIKRQKEELREGAGSAGSVIAVIMLILGIGAFIGLIVWSSKRQRKRIKEMCGGITDWAQKVLCEQNVTGQGRGGRSYGRTGLNLGKGGFSINL